MEKQDNDNNKNINININTDKKKTDGINKYTIVILIIIVFTALAWFLFFSGKDNAPADCPAELFTKYTSGHKLPKTESKFPIMGTFAQVTVYAEPEQAKKAIKTVREVFAVFEDKCNIFNPESEISRLNATAGKKAFKCSPLIWNMLNSSRRAYVLSRGAFDITARPLMQLWGFYRKRGNSLPAAEEIKSTLDKTGMDKVIFDDKGHTVKFKVAGMSIDLGGIAKGIAVQVAARKIHAMGIRNAVVNLGGNMYCLGSPPAPREFYSIGVRNPLEKNKICARLPLRNQAVATSGNYERYVTVNGRHYTHIMNPKTGKPVENMLSTTIVCPDAGDADFLSTAVFINGAEYAKNICKANPQIKIIIIRRKPENKSETETLYFGEIKKI
jgi:thiamine biosynthesis lipoprotein